ncbi:cytosolic carboxypeptidase 2-like [Babylonia areolata]|uniref:cytosolic carboxypeptidase 2-like n=1 Tax=Babylonia areolata TaxID=304850 RepID=UPI003FD1B9F2
MCTCVFSCVKECSLTCVQKSEKAMPDGEVIVSSLNRTLPPADEPTWRRDIKERLETEIEKRVRDALSTPPSERLKRRRQLAQEKTVPEGDINSHLLLDQTAAKDRLKARRWRALKAFPEPSTMMPSFPPSQPPVQLLFKDQLSRSNQDQFPGVFGLENLSEGIKNIREDFTSVVNRIGTKPKARHFYTKEGFLKAVRGGNLPVGVRELGNTGLYEDKYGVVRDSDGPFWPMDCVPLFPTPRFEVGRGSGVELEPLYDTLPESDKTTADNQTTCYHGQWKGTLIVYDSEKSPRDHCPTPVTEGLCPSLRFESRFESGNLRQARRIGMFEYELVLQTDLYTRRHTQWYFFRVWGAQPGVVYKFTIVNLLKPDSLYNYGMRPLLYCDRGGTIAEGQRQQGAGWRRCGHHISYGKNLSHLSCPLLPRSLHHYLLQWHMEFPHGAEDRYYLAHCYPYTFTDLKGDLARLTSRADSKAHVKKEVLCESRAGNSCFLLTITNFEKAAPRRVVVVTARVHPGESQASWMMRGLLDFLTSPHPSAQELRDRFQFKVVPMINPDGVIVGNYRCSLAARDLNRNYRQPRRPNFPTVHAVKAMMEDLAAKYEIVLYCDLHGHSRKHNVFMYGNNTSSPSTGGGVRSFISERLFPWLMASTCRDKFSFPSCKFHIQRCKESTGRVVMWRQLHVLNSFTLEASFSGTVLDMNQRRHFNIHDLMDVGRALALTVLEYQNLQDDPV